MTDGKAAGREIREKKLTAPRITPEDLEAKIIREMYYVFPETTLTVCCLVLENGFCVTGESACAHPANFNAEVGRKIARAEAKDKIWSLEGYLLRQELHEQEKAPAEACRCGHGSAQHICRIGMPSCGWCGCPEGSVTTANPLRITLNKPFIPGAAGGVTTIIVGSI